MTEYVNKMCFFWLGICLLLIAFVFFISVIQIQSTNNKQQMINSVNNKYNVEILETQKLSKVSNENGAFSEPVKVKTDTGVIKDYYVQNVGNNNFLLLYKDNDTYQYVKEAH